MMIQAIGNDYVYVSNVTGINCKQVMSIVGPNLTDRAGTNNVIVSNLYATINDFGDATGNTSVCDFANIENVVLNNVNLLPPFKDDGTFDLTGITRYGIQSVRVNKLTVQNSSVYFSNRAIDFGINNELWAKPQSLVVQNCQFDSVDAIFGITRIISFGVSATTNLEFVKLNGLTFKVPMADAYGKTIIQGLNTELLEVSDIQVKHTTVNTNYARVCNIDGSVDRSVISNVTVTANTDLGSLTQLTTNPVVYSFDGTNCTIDNIDGGYQDGVLISNSFVLGSLTNIKATNDALILYAGLSSATTYLEKASIRTNGVPFP